MYFRKLLILVFTINVVCAQQKQAGIELAVSFPAFSEGNIEPDLPADGYYWDANNPGWGIGIEVQANKNAESGYFIFGSVYSYKDDGSPFWCVFSQPYRYNNEVRQWREAKSFSNLRYGHDDIQRMAEMDVECTSLKNEPSINTTNSSTVKPLESIMLNLVWRTPTTIEVTASGGTKHYMNKFSFYDDLNQPSLDWIMETHWAIMSDVTSYSSTGERNSKISSNDNMTTRFERLNEDEHQNLKDFVGHQNDWEYYISTIKSSNIGTIYSDTATPSTNIFEPIIGVGFSNFFWIVLVHDKPKNRVMLFTVAGNKEPGELRPDAGRNIKFIADVTHDAISSATHR